MCLRPFLAALAALVVASTVAKADMPYPTVDFEGDWVLAGDGVEMRAKMRYRAAGNRIRVEMSQQGMAMTSIMNMAAGEALMWSDQMPGIAMRIAIPTDHGVTPEETSENRMHGGESCTVWVAEHGQACLTADNIPIEASGDGFSARLDNLQRREQEASLFGPPSGMQVMELPAGMPGFSEMMPGGLGLPF